MEGQIRPLYAYTLPELDEYRYSAAGDEYVKPAVYLTKRELEEKYGLYADNDTTFGYHIETLSDKVPDWRNNMENCKDIIFTMYRRGN